LFSPVGNLLFYYYYSFSQFTCINEQMKRNKRHSSPFINVVKSVFFVVRVTLLPVSYLSAPSAVHSYKVPGKNRPEKLAIMPVSKARTNKFDIYRQCTYIVYLLSYTNLQLSRWIHVWAYTVYCWSSITWLWRKAFIDHEMLLKLNTKLKRVY
jgi:hypothetical protein